MVTSVVASVVPVFSTVEPVFSTVDPVFSVSAVVAVVALALQEPHRLQLLAQYWHFCALV